MLLLLSFTRSEKFSYSQTNGKCSNVFSSLLTLKIVMPSIFIILFYLHLVLVQNTDDQYKITSSFSHFPSRFLFLRRLFFYFFPILIIMKRKLYIFLIIRQ